MTMIVCEVPVVKHPAERLKLTARFARLLGSTGLLTTTASAALATSPTVTDDSSADITISGAALSTDQKSVVFFVDGGTAELNHRVTVKVNDSNGQTLVILGDILIRDS